MDRFSYARGIDKPVETFGGIDTDRQEPDVIDACQIGAQDAADGLGDGVVGAVPTHQGAELFEAEPGHLHPGFDSLLPGSTKGTPGPARFSRRQLLDSDNVNRPDIWRFRQQVVGHLAELRRDLTVEVSFSTPIGGEGVEDPVGGVGQFERVPRDGSRLGHGDSAGSREELPELVAFARFGFQNGEYSAGHAHVFPTLYESFDDALGAPVPRGAGESDLLGTVAASEH